MFDFNDEAIQKPDQDVFGIDPLAKAISDCIRQMDNPVGSVVAINGPWGSGKSSLINLVRHHLDLKDPDLTVVEFQSWLYRTEADLVAAFFRELYSALKPALARSGKTFSKLGAIVAGAGSMAVTTGEPTAEVIGKALKLATSTLQKHIESGDDTTQLQQRVRKELDKQPRKFLFIVDDLDRLSPDQALTVFRLIKSVGRLPKVMYLLAFDRVTTERAVADKFPSEGPHYLEKIVQAGFELPPISVSLFDSMLRKRLDEIFSDFEPDATFRSHKLYRDGVLSEIRTVRDIKRLTSMLSVTWGAVHGEVDDVDFLLMETLRLFRPHVYDAIRNNKQLLVGDKPVPTGFGADGTETFDPLFLNRENKDQRDRLRSVLLDLFPPVTSISSDIPNRSEEIERSRNRRVWAREHFDTYFGCASRTAKLENP